MLSLNHRKVEDGSLTYEQLIYSGGETVLLDCFLEYLCIMLISEHSYPLIKEQEQMQNNYHNNNISSTSRVQGKNADSAGPV